jgi:DNA-binding SARP family transcriptional activator/tetratricopeptide (TPR) repeat protein
LAVSWEFGLLGPVLVLRDGTPVPMARGGQQAVLAALLLRAGRLVTTGELAEVLWGTEPPPTAGAALRNQVRRLRAALGPGDGQRICTEPGGYLIRVQPDELDLSQAQGLLAEARSAAGKGDWEQVSARAAAGLLLWRGQPMAGVRSDVLARAVSGLAEIQLSLSELRLDAEIRLGRAAGTVSELRQLCAAHPLREHLHALLMLALHRCGRRAEALAAYQAVRRVLIEELGSEPAAGLQELHQQVLAGTGPEPPAALARADGGPGPARRQASAGQPAADGTAAALPRQLPAPDRHFTGRQPELAALSALLDRDTATAVVISAIGGTAGVGKTALALAWAHQVAERFPDGQLYVNLRGFDPAGLPPLTAGEAVRGFLAALQPPGSPQLASMQAQVGLYRSLLAGKRMLIVLDNAGNADQVRPLLPASPGCLVVVTSRNRLTGLAVTDGAHLLNLEVLTDAEARHLLQARLGPDRVAAEPAAAGELARLCGRLPLALAVAAAYATSVPRLPLADLMRQLRDTENGFDLLADGDPASSMRAVFSCSATKLSSAALRLFRLLSLHDAADISSPAAASLAGVSGHQTRRWLRQLTEASLLTELAPGRYACHDLIRTYARQQAEISMTGAERQEAVHRLLDHYLHTALAAAALLSPSRGNIFSPAPAGPGVTPESLAGHQQARTWFEAEHRTLLAAVSLAAEAGFDAHAWQLAWATADFLDWRSYWREMAATQRIAAQAAASASNTGAEAEPRRLLARPYVRLADHAEARIHLTACLKFYCQLGDRADQARTHQSLSWAGERLGDPRVALGHAERALGLFRSLGDQAGQARCLNNIGYCHAQLGDYQQARSSCRQAIELWRAAGDRAGEAPTWAAFEV